MILGGVVFLRSFYALEFGFGVLLACGLNIAKVLLLKFAVDKATKMTAGITAYTGGMYMLRFLLTGVVLVVAYFLSGDEPHIIFFGAAVGLIAMPIASYALRFFIKDDVPETTNMSEDDD